MMSVGSLSSISTKTGMSSPESRSAVNVCTPSSWKSSAITFCTPGTEAAIPFQMGQ